MTTEKKILQDVENSPKLHDIVTDILTEKKRKESCGAHPQHTL
jgi:hypothetical protein